MLMDVQLVLKGVVLIVLTYLVARIMLRVTAAPRDTKWELLPATDGTSTTLVVLVHGLLGRETLVGADDLVARVLPDADRLVIDYHAGFITNLDAYATADVIEQAVADAFRHKRYGQIVLLGHSAGAALLRKVFVWGHGHEEDRERFGRRGKREWVDHVDRIILLAGMNRGWSTSPRPREMPLGTFLSMRLGEYAARLFGIGRFALASRRGEPFIADTRVQWIRLARSSAVIDGPQPFPRVIQLIGSLDDVVSREDGQDLLAARGTLFKTLPQTTHKDICRVLSGDDSPGAAHRIARITQALLGDVEALEPDKILMRQEDRQTTRIVYVMHGIRDYANWTDVLRADIEHRCATADGATVVVNPKYGYFAMAPFLIYADRQRNVRRFMDQYTEDLACRPNVITVDFAGHSNGTYILASALQKYATLRVRRVFFAGSVVPKHYPWLALLDAGRVDRVINVVATRDWVVALFPKLFEQIADYLGVRPTSGWLDLGAAGFRGFLDAIGPSRVDDLKFASGAHSTGVDISTQAKLDAISAYLATGEEAGFAAFRSEKSQHRALSFLSNVTPFIWVAIILVLMALGIAAFVYTGWAGLLIFLALVVMLLYSA
ncbi:MAG TPA: hypothetical protein VMR06_02505 [Dokdonella sp.]|uniref:hypothetical protein n=1 Tax=Dokdonella sp. TaxID=2291710 RepID=UPI002C3A5659|nr:hypothetical protein [Dokdonella sp.]HUD40848.1 hypothetical protein [Dokdonella sp.]